MAIKTSTPPNFLKTLFPLEGNQHLVDDLAAKGHRIFVFDSSILFEGDIKETSYMKEKLTGGVTA